MVLSSDRIITKLSFFLFLLFSSAWVFISYCLGGDVAEQQSSEIDKRRRFSLILALLTEIHRRSKFNAIPVELRRKNVTQSVNKMQTDVIQNNQEVESGHYGEVVMEQDPDSISQEDHDFSADMDTLLYDSLCLVVLSRIFQRAHLRNLFSNALLTALPNIPLVLLSTLRMLMYGGTNGDPQSAADQSTTRKRRKADGHQPDVGTRVAAVEALVRCCLVEPINIENPVTVGSLFPLLWATISADFKLRNSVISFIVRYVY